LHGQNPVIATKRGMALIIAHLLLRKKTKKINSKTDIITAIPLPIEPRLLLIDCSFKII
jgi:hypothetical protein